MKRISLLLIIIYLNASSINAQDAQSPVDLTPPCSVEEFAQFDFWIGQWDLTWSDTAHGSNMVAKDYDGCVIIENFDSHPSGSFKGMSVSTYDIRSSLWKQTWVDNSGGYLNFSGGWEKDRMILSRSFINNDSTISQRMVWFNITEKSFDWNWERSTDNGASWTTLWSIKYERKKEIFDLTGH